MIVETNDGLRKTYDRMDGSGSRIKLYPNKNKSFCENKRPDQIRRIIQSAPPLVVSMLNAFDKKRFATLSSDKCAGILGKYKNSGWGISLSYVHGVSLLRMGKKEDAKKAYQEALKRFGPKDPYARFTEEKLESLGV